MKRIVQVMESEQISVLYSKQYKYWVTQEVHSAPSLPAYITLLQPKIAEMKQDGEMRRILVKQGLISCVLSARGHSKVDIS